MSTNDIVDLNHKHIINLDCEKVNNFKKELINVLEEGFEKLAFKFSMLKYEGDELNKYRDISYCFRSIANDLKNKIDL